MRTMLISIPSLLLLAFTVITYPQTVNAADNTQALELAPQNEGPSLEVTLKFIKDKVNALRGFQYWNTASGWRMRNVVNTKFDIKPDYSVEIIQVAHDIVEEKAEQWGDEIKHFHCDLKTLSSANKSTYYKNLASVRLSFHSDCKDISGETGGTETVKTYPRIPPFYIGLAEFDTGDELLAKRLVEAFNHAAPLLQKLPKQRKEKVNNEPF